MKHVALVWKQGDEDNVMILTLEDGTVTFDSPEEAVNAALQNDLVSEFTVAALESLK